MTKTLTTLIEELQHLDRHVRSQAALSIGNLGDTSALDALLEALVSEYEVFVREDMTWALVRIGDAAVMPLIARLDDENPVARHAAAHTLGKIGDTRAVDALIHKLQDSDKAVVLKTAFVLGQIGDVKAIPALVRLLGHSERDIQTTLFNVLEGFGTPAVQPLIAAMSDEQWQVREHAADILGLIGNQQAVDALAKALHDEHWQVRFAALTALGHIGGARAKDAVKALNDDADQRVRTLVPEVMRRIKA
jgi:HEAT repeat protein